jgi:hypothetical protein
MADRIMIHVVPYVISDGGFSRVLNGEEVKAVGLKIPTYEKEVYSYIDGISLLKEKITRIQEILGETNKS